jgi:transposase
MKNRIHATLSKYGVRVEGVSDLFGKRGSELLEQAVDQLPDEARQTMQTMIADVRRRNEEIAEYERSIKERMRENEDLKLLQTIPGVGFVLAVVILLEVGDVSRFSRPEKLAAYSGTTPRIYQSGQTRRYGQVRNDVNRTLKHAFTEAANAVCMHQNHPRYRHVGALYQRIKSRKGHQKAIGAVARHLAEATYWILTKKEEYRAPNDKTVVSTQG